MKAIITACFCLVLFAATGTAQIKKPKKEVATKTEAAPPAAKDTFSIPYRYVSGIDTIKVRLVLYVEDNSLYWKNGYVIIPYNKSVETNEKKEKVGPGLRRYYDDKFLRVQEADIYTATNFNW